MDRVTKNSIAFKLYKSSKYSLHKSLKKIVEYCLSGGLYVCKECGAVINADVNGAMNILKKVSPNFFNGIGVVDLTSPMRVNVSKLTYRIKNPCISTRGVG